MYNTTRNVTPIDMLPDLEDLESVHHVAPYIPPTSSIIPPSDIDRVNRHIRGGHIPPQQAGMHYNQNNNMYNNPSNNKSINRYEYMVNDDENLKPNIENAKLAQHNGGPTCIDFADHIGYCPICCKLYNNDKTIYIIAIIVLAVICILLLKKVLEL